MPSPDHITKPASQVLPAPNGEPSNLSPELHAYVRSEEFKQWFGDWQNDPMHASQVLDDNGEPLVLYRGQMSHADTPFVNHGDGIYFTPDRHAAIGYGADANPIPVFLNARNPYKVDFEGDTDNESNDLHADIRGEYHHAKEEGYDILIATNTFDGENDLDQYVVHSDAQVRRIDTLRLKADIADVPANDLDTTARQHVKEEIFSSPIATEQKIDQTNPNTPSLSPQATVVPSRTQSPEQQAGQRTNHNANETTTTVQPAINAQPNKPNEYIFPSPIATEQMADTTFMQPSSVTQFQFIGETGARQLDHAAHSLAILLNLATAKEMTEAERDALSIKMATGWEQGTDSKWRYELPDIQMPESSLSLLRNGKTDGSPVTLGDLMPQAPFLEAYPEMAHMPVVNDKERLRGAAYDPEARLITISNNELHVFDTDDLNAMDVSETLLHEIQHAIQHIEGFAMGGNIQTVANRQRLEAEKEMAALRDIYKAYELIDFRTQSADTHEALMAYEERDRYERQHEQELKTYILARQRMEMAELDMVAGRLSEKNYQNYRSLAGEVEARNTVARAGMTPEERRRTLAAATEDVARESQTVIFGDISSLIREPQTALLHNDTILRDKLVRLMQEAGIVVNTDWREGQAVLEAAHSGIRLQNATEKTRNVAKDRRTYVDDSTFNIPDQNDIATKPQVEEEKTRNVANNHRAYFNDSTFNIPNQNEIATKQHVEEEKTRNVAKDRRTYVDDSTFNIPDQNDIATRSQVATKKNRNVADGHDIRFQLANTSPLPPPTQQPIFISNALIALSKIQQQKATPEQWLAMLQSHGGIKAGEDRWTGLSDWLRDSTEKSLTRQQVLDFIAQNQVVVEETNYGLPEDTPMFIQLNEEFNEEKNKVDSLYEEADREYGEFLDRMAEKYGPNFDIENDLTRKEHKEEDRLLTRRNSYDTLETDNTPESIAYETMKERYGSEFSFAFDYNEEGLEVRSERYAAAFLGIRLINDQRLGLTTENLKEKKEIALTVPTIEGWKEDDDIHFGDADNGRAIAWVRFGDTVMSHKASEEEVQRRIERMPKAEEWEKVDGSHFVNKHDVYFFPGTRNMTGHSYIYNDNKGHFSIEGPMARRMLNTRFDSLQDAVNAFNRQWVRTRQDTYMEKVLVIDEIQSKRHQSGHKKGYMATPAAKAWNDYRDQLSREHPEGWSVDNPEARKRGAHILTEEELNRLDGYLTERNREAREMRERKLVPEAPFERSWHELAMKRMLRYAAENGYDRVAWTTGEQQAERYDIGDVVSQIVVGEMRTADELNRYFGDKNIKQDGKNVTLIMKDPTKSVGLAIDEEGTIFYCHETEEMENKKLEELVGKKLADDILKADNQTFPTEEIKIGTEGITAFYDQMLPQFVNRYAKKWNVRTEDVEIPNIEGWGVKTTLHSVSVTPQMKADVMQGQPMFFLTPQGDAYGFTHDKTIYIDPRIATSETPVHEYAHLWAQAMRQYNPKEWQNIVRLMQQVRPVWEMVQSQYTHLSSDSDIAEEVLAQYSGKEGMGLLQRTLRNHDNDLSDRQAGDIINRIREAIDRFWQKTADFLHIHYRSADEVASRVMHDLLHQVNPQLLVQQPKGEAIPSPIATTQNTRNILAFSYAPYTKVQGLAHAIKDGDEKAIKEAASRMADMINDMPDKRNVVLVPMPSHEGRATYTKALAEEVARLTGLPTADILSAQPHAPLYDLKKANGLHGLPVPSITLNENLPKGKTPVIIDNVLDTGTTAYAAAKAFPAGTNVLVAVLGNTDNFYHFHNGITLQNQGRPDRVSHDKESLAIPSPPITDQKSSQQAKVVPSPTRSSDSLTGQNTEQYPKAEKAFSFPIANDQKDGQTTRQRPKEETFSSPTATPAAPTISYQLVGPKGAAEMDRQDSRNRMSYLMMAMTMEKGNHSPEEIKMATGWEKAADGKWRYEIPDILLNADHFAVRWVELYQQYWNALRNTSAENFHKDVAPYQEQLDRLYLQFRQEHRLGDILSPDSPVLKAYPDIRDFRLRIYNSQKGGAGFFDTRTNTVLLNLYGRTSAWSIAGTLAHELQHIIQFKEGFAYGAPLRSASETAALQQQMRNLDQKADDACKEKTRLFHQLYAIPGWSQRAHIAYYKVTDENHKGFGDDVKNADPVRSRQMIDNLRNSQPLRYRLGVELIKQIDAKEQQILKILGERMRIERKMSAPDRNHTVSAGEVEARNVRTRMDMTPEDRRRTTAESTEDVARMFQQVSYDYLLSANEAQDTDDHEIIVTRDGEETARILAKQAYKNEDDTHVGYSKTISDGGERGKEHLIRNIFYDDKSIGFATATLSTGEGNIFALLSEDAYKESFLLDVPVSPYDRAKDAWEGIDDKELDGYYDHGCMLFADEQQMIDFYTAHRQVIDYRNERFEHIHSLAQTDRDVAERLSLALPVNEVSDIKAAMTRLSSNGQQPMPETPSFPSPTAADKKTAQIDSITPNNTTPSTMPTQIQQRDFLQDFLDSKSKLQAAKAEQNLSKRVNFELPDRSFRIMTNAEFIRYALDNDLPVAATPEKGNIPEAKIEAIRNAFTGFNQHIIRRNLGSHYKPTPEMRDFEQLLDKMLMGRGEEKPSNQQFLEARKKAEESIIAANTPTKMFYHVRFDSDGASMAISKTMYDYAAFIQQETVKDLTRQLTDILSEPRFSEWLRKNEEGVLLISEADILRMNNGQLQLGWYHMPEGETVPTFVPDDLGRREYHQQVNILREGIETATALRRDMLLGDLLEQLHSNRITLEEPVTVQLREGGMAAITAVAQDNHGHDTYLVSEQGQPLIPLYVNSQDFDKAVDKAIEDGEQQLLVQLNRERMEPELSEMRRQLLELMQDEKLMHFIAPFPEVKLGVGNEGEIYLKDGELRVNDFDPNGRQYDIPLAEERPHVQMADLQEALQTAHVFQARMRLLDDMEAADVNQATLVPDADLTVRLEGWEETGNTHQVAAIQIEKNHFRVTDTEGNSFPSYDIVTEDEIFLLNRVNDLLKSETGIEMNKTRQLPEQSPAENQTDLREKLLSLMNERQLDTVSLAYDDKVVKDADDRLTYVTTIQGTNVVDIPFEEMTREEGDRLAQQAIDSILKEPRMKMAHEELREVMREYGIQKMELPWGDSIELQGGKLTIHGHNEDATPTDIDYDTLTHGQQSWIFNHVAENIQKMEEDLAAKEMKLAAMMVDMQTDRLPVDDSVATLYHVPDAKERRDIIVNAIRMDDEGALKVVSDENREYPMECLHMPDQVTVVDNAVRMVTELQQKEKEQTLDPDEGRGMTYPQYLLQLMQASKVQTLGLYDGKVIDNNEGVLIYKDLTRTVPLSDLPKEERDTLAWSASEQLVSHLESQLERFVQGTEDKEVTLPNGDAARLDDTRSHDKLRLILHDADGNAEDYGKMDKLEKIGVMTAFADIAAQEARDLFMAHVANREDDRLHLSPDNWIERLPDTHLALVRIDEDEGRKALSFEHVNGFTQLNVVNFAIEQQEALDRQLSAQQTSQQLSPQATVAPSQSQTTDQQAAQQTTQAAQSQQPEGKTIPSPIATPADLSQEAERMRERVASLMAENEIRNVSFEPTTVHPFATWPGDMHSDETQTIDGIHRNDSGGLQVTDGDVLLNSVSEYLPQEQTVMLRKAEAAILQNLGQQLGNSSAVQLDMARIERFLGAEMLPKERDAFLDKIRHNDNLMAVVEERMTLRVQPDVLVKYAESEQQAQELRVMAMMGMLDQHVIPSWGGSFLAAEDNGLVWNKVDGSKEQQKVLDMPGAIARTTLQMAIDDLAPQMEEKVKYILGDQPDNLLTVTDIPLKVRTKDHDNNFHDAIVIAGSIGIFSDDGLYVRDTEDKVHPLNTLHDESRILLLNEAVRSSRDRSEEIEAYLTHQMPEEQRNDFEKEMQNNPELKEEVATTAALIQGIREKGREEDRTAIERMKEDIPVTEQYYDNAMAAAREHVAKAFPNSDIALSPGRDIVIDGKETHLAPMVLPMDENEKQAFVFVDRDNSENGDALALAKRHGEQHPGTVVAGEDAYAFFDINDAIDFKRKADLLPEVRKLEDLAKRAQEALPFANPQWQRDNDEQIEGARLMMYGTDSGIRAEYLEIAPYEGRKVELGFAVGNGIDNHNIDSLTEIYFNQHPDQQMVNLGGDDMTVKFQDVRHAMQFQAFVQQLVNAEPELSDAQARNMADIRGRFPDTLVINRNGDGYEAYGKDAQKLSSLLDLPTDYSKGFAVTRFEARDIDSALTETIGKGQHVTVVDDKELSIRTQAKVMNEIGSQLIELMGEGRHSLVGQPPTEQLQGFHVATKGNHGHMNFTELTLSQDKVPTVSLVSEDQKTNMSLLLLPLEQQQNLLHYARALEAYKSIQQTIDDNLTQQPSPQATVAPSPNPSQAPVDLQPAGQRDGDLQSSSQSDRQPSPQATVAPSPNPPANEPTDQKAEQHPKEKVFSSPTASATKEVPTIPDVLDDIRSQLRDSGLRVMPVRFDTDDRRYMDISGRVHAPFLDFSAKGNHRPETVIAPVSVEYHKDSDALLLHGKNANGDYLTIPLDTPTRGNRHAYTVLREQLEQPLQKAMQHANMVEYLADESVTNGRASDTFIRNVANSVLRAGNGNTVHVGEYDRTSGQLPVTETDEQGHVLNETRMDALKVAGMVSRKEAVAVSRADLAEASLSYPSLEEVMRKRAAIEGFEQARLNEKYLYTVFEHRDPNWNEKGIIIKAGMEDYSPWGKRVELTSESNLGTMIFCPDEPHCQYVQTGNKIDGIIHDISKMGFIDREQNIPYLLMDPISYSRDRNRMAGPDHVLYDDAMVDFGPNHFYFQQILSGPEKGRYHASYEIEDLDHGTREKVVDGDIDMVYERMRHVLLGYDLRENQSHSLHQTEKLVRDITSQALDQMVTLTGRIHNIPTGDREMADDPRFPIMDVSMIEVNREGKIILHGNGGPAPLDSLDETARFEVLRRTANDMMDQNLDLPVKRQQLMRHVMDNYHYIDIIKPFDAPRMLQNRNGDYRAVGAAVVDDQQNITLFHNVADAFQFLTAKNPKDNDGLYRTDFNDLTPASQRKVLDGALTFYGSQGMQQQAFKEAEDLAERMTTQHIPFSNNMSNPNSEEKIMKPEEQKPLMEQPKAEQQQQEKEQQKAATQSPAREQATEQIRSAIGPDRKVRLDENERVTLETTKGATINVQSVSVTKNESVSLYGEIDGTKKSVSAAQLTDDALTRLAAHLSDLRSAKQAVAAEQPAEQKADATVTQKPAQETQAAQEQKPAQAAEQKADQPKERKVEPIEIKPDSKVEYNITKNPVLDRVYDIQLFVDGEKKAGHHLSVEDRKDFFDKKVTGPELVPKYFEKELAGQQLPEVIERHHAERKQEAKEQKPEQEQKAEQPKERKTDTVEIKPDSKVQVNVVPNKALDHVYDIQLFVDGEKQGRGHHLSIEDRKAFFDQKTPEEKTAFAASLLPKYFEKELAGQKLPDNIDRYRPERKQEAQEQKPAQAAEQKPAKEQKAEQQTAASPVDVWKNARGNDGQERTTFVQRDGQYGKFYQTYGDDAAKVGQLTEKPTKEVKEGPNAGLAYINVKQADMPDLMKKMKEQEVPYKVVGMDGKYARVLEPQAKTQAADLSAYKVPEGKQVTDVKVWQFQGKPFMNGVVDGNKLDQKEISKEDWTAFKEQKATPEQLVGKYYSPAEMESRQAQKQTKSMAR